MTALQIQQRVLQMQERLIEMQKVLVEIDANANAEGTELTPNADEFLVAMMDGGQKAMDLASDLLNSVSTFLKKLG